jgi:hypothetical protein
MVRNETASPSMKRFTIRNSMWFAQCESSVCPDISLELYPFVKKQCKFQAQNMPDIAQINLMKYQTPKY